MPEYELHQGIKCVWLVGCVQVLKILSRRRDNRLQIGRQGIQIVFQHLRSIVSKPIAAEAANIVLNVCYEKASVALVVQCRGVETLVSCLSDSNADLQANAAGAIQSICFQVGYDTSCSCSWAVHTLMSNDQHQEECLQRPALAARKASIILSASAQTHVA